jgi:hypothetical protein
MRVQFEVVDLAIAQMYNDVDYSTTDKIDAHCQMVESFLEACGYTVDEYLEQMLEHGLQEFLPTKDMSN